MTPASLPQSGIDFVKRWVWSTFVGWMFALLAIIPALAIWEIITSVGWAHRDTGWYQFWSAYLTDITFNVLMLVTLIVMGISIGLAQWQIALRDKIGKKRWLFANAFLIIAAGIGFLISSPISPGILAVQSGIMSGMDDYFTLKETWLLGVLTRGIVIGAAIGLPQWLILRRTFYKAHHWWFAVILGSVAVFASAVTIISIVKSVLISETLICCLSPIAFGTVTGIALYHLLNRSKDISL
ncbi:MAG: hypothetical protein ABI690_24805 [Chloroflexota bacterium]